MAKTGDFYFSLYLHNSRRKYSFFYRGLLPMNKLFLLVMWVSWMLALMVAAASGREPLSATQVSAEKLVRSSAGALLKLQSFDLRVVTKQSINDGQYIRTFQTYLNTAFDQSGNRKRIHMESRRPEDTLTIVSDGDSYWIYHDRNHSYMHQTGILPIKVYQGITPGFSDALSAENLPSSMQSAKIVRQENLTIGDREELCDVVVVELKPGAALSGNEIEHNEVTLWLSHAFGVPMKLSGTFIHKDEKGEPQAMDVTVEVRQFHPNVQLPPSTWIFVPPPDSHLAAAQTSKGALIRRK